MKAAAIVNSNKLRRRKSAEAVYRISKLINARLYFTKHRGHAEELAREASDCDVVMAAGGDGTVYEVINNMDLDSQILAVLPLGTGNALAADIGLRTAACAEDAILRSAEHRIDLISCRIRCGANWIERYAVTTTSLGFVADAAMLACGRLRLFGPSCYALGGFAALFLHERHDCLIAIDGGYPKAASFTNLIINNSAYAGNAKIFPGASLTDAGLNMLISMTNPAYQFMHNLSVLSKTYVYSSGTESIIRCASVELRQPTTLMIDGEFIESVDELICNVAPGKLRVYR